jgi:hypothetical protein
MQRALYIALVIALGTSACSDKISAPDPVGYPIIIPAAGLQTVIGTIEQREGNLWLRQDAGGSLRLMGPESAPLTSVVGAEVEVRGSNDGALEGFMVAEFSVRAVAGQPAADGILEVVDEGLGLRLANKSLRMIVDPPEGLAQLVGKRVWIAGPADQCPVGFGVISAVI